MDIKIICSNCFWMGNEFDLSVQKKKKKSVNVCPNCYSEELGFEFQNEGSYEELFSEELDDL